jgi:hypothetical protein
MARVTMDVEQIDFFSSVIAKQNGVQARRMSPVFSMLRVEIVINV